MTGRDQRPVSIRDRGMEEVALVTMIGTGFRELSCWKLIPSKKEEVLFGDPIIH